jgi:hypothetical protein
VATTVKFILVLRFRQTLKTTRTNPSFCRELAWREFSNNTNDKLQDIDYFQWSYWQGVLQLPFYIPAMERRREKVPRFIRLANVIKFVCVKPTIVETLRKRCLVIFSGEFVIRYDTSGEDGEKDTSERWKPEVAA